MKSARINKRLRRHSNQSIESVGWANAGHAFCIDDPHSQLQPINDPASGAGTKVQVQMCQVPGANVPPTFSSGCKGATHFSSVRMGHDLVALGPCRRRWRFRAVGDLGHFQRQHAILHNYPAVGHFRAILNRLGPKVRQYFIAHNDEERPFSRDERRWVYTSADKANNYFGFGTDNAIESTPNYIIIKHSAFPPPDDHTDPSFSLPVLKTMGGARRRKYAFSLPRSLTSL